MFCFLLTLTHGSSVCIRVHFNSHISVLFDFMRVVILHATRESSVLVLTSPVHYPQSPALRGLYPTGSEITRRKIGREFFFFQFSYENNMKRNLSYAL